MVQIILDAFPDAVSEFGLLGCLWLVLITSFAAIGILMSLQSAYRYVMVRRHMAQWRELVPYKRRAKRRAYMLKHGY